MRTNTPVREPRSVRHDAAGLLFDQAVLRAHQRVVREHQIADRGADLQRVAARDDAGAERAALEHLHDAERRRPLGRRVEVGRVRIGAVVRDGVLLDAQQLIADHELVAELELDRRADAQEHAVAAAQILEPEPAVLRKLMHGLARVAEALAWRGRCRPRDPTNDLGPVGLEALGTAPQAAQHVEREIVAPAGLRGSARERRLGGDRASAARADGFVRRCFGDRGLTGVGARFLLARELLDVLDVRRLGESVMPPISRPSMTASKRPSRSISTISRCCAFIRLRTNSATSGRARARRSRACGS